MDPKSSRLNNICEDESSSLTMRKLKWKGLSRILKYKDIFPFFGSSNSACFGQVPTYHELNVQQ